MKIEKDKMVSVTYELRTGGKEGEIIEISSADEPLSFPFGSGMLLPAFEDGINGKIVGDKFEIEITSKNAYGDVEEHMVVNIPKNVFEIEGKFDEELIAIGETLPMMSSNGDQVVGIVKNVDEKFVTMDFNHPLAGKDLYFIGEVVDVRDATEEELNEGFDFGEFGGCCDDEECEGCGDECEHNHDEE